MIDIQNITIGQIKEFAGSVIFNRGLDYFNDDLVEDFEYDPKGMIINAKVIGSYTYYVEIKGVQSSFYAECNCPYEGYPCKHIVAVLLYYTENKNRYLKEQKRQSDLETVMNNNLMQFPKDELVKMILTLSQKHAVVKRDLMLRLSIDNDKSFRYFTKAIDKINSKFENNTLATYDVSSEFKSILNQVEKADPDLYLEVLWKILNLLLYQLNNYGMSDIAFEDLAMSSLNKLVELFGENPHLKESFPHIIDELEEYCDWGNCGIADEICEAYYAITEDID